MIRHIYWLTLTAALLSGCGTTQPTNVSEQPRVNNPDAFKPFADGAVRVVTDNGNSLLTGTLIKARTGFYLLSSKHGFRTVEQVLELKQGTNTLSVRLGVIISIPTADIIIAKLRPEGRFDVESQLFSSTPAETFKPHQGPLELSQELYCTSTFEKPSGVIVSILEQRHLAAQSNKVNGILTQEPSAPTKSGGICTTVSGEVVGITKGNLVGKDPYTIGVIEQLEPSLASIISVL
ncbi:hypothetical protein [Pseudoalteromonas sp. MMG012]|uniref:hypothetical protein n=1 Tax=Pseudoalteromonas sp. MMG012 TaxID=2822686 RepID=UPI001B3A3F4E|nr:hypothetical protein [Pseudoalteromonas sp. MMG012]MBQ4852850.1 hypothetical protein [Pseudoalteromonas sp. MMG012]